MKAEIKAGTRAAVVTGGASGIGRATAVAFAARGYRVAVWDLDEQAAAVLCAVLPDAIALDVDIGKPREVQQAVTATVDELGRLDVLVAGAAVGS